MSNFTDLKRKTACMNAVKDFSPIRREWDDTSVGHCYLATDWTNSRLTKHLYFGASNWPSLPTEPSSCRLTRLEIWNGGKNCGNLGQNSQTSMDRCISYESIWLQTYRSTWLQTYRSTRLQTCRSTRLQTYRCTDSDWPEYRGVSWAGLYPRL